MFLTKVNLKNQVDSVQEIQTNYRRYFKETPEENGGFRWTSFRRVV
jgi:hypothetical protein